MSHVLRTRKRPIVMVGLIVAAAGAWFSHTGVAADAAGKERSASSRAGTKRMAERLAQIAGEAEANPDDNPYLNHARARRLRSLLPGISDPAKQAEFRSYLARELLFAGETQASLKELDALWRQISQPGASISPKLRQEVQYLLGLAHLRWGEQQNCLEAHNPQSCLLPIKGKGVHVIQDGSRKALKYFRAILEERPEELASRWLLNIASMTLGEYPDQVSEEWIIPFDTFDSDYEMQPFPEIAGALGLDVDGLAGGSVMEDFDGDGYLDVMVSSWGLRDQLRYFRNNGDGSFSERTEQAGLLGLTGGLNLVHADYDNDGHVDVFVLRGAWMGEGGRHPNSLLKNNGDGSFEDVTEQAGVLSFHPTQTAAWGDFDNDGRLDLFVGNETTGRQEHPCELFRNNGDGTFTEIAAAVGLANVGYVKGVGWGDYNNDGLIDLYLSRLGQSNVLYRNDGPVGDESHGEDDAATPAVFPWRFTDVSVEAGVTLPRDSFPTWFWDYDNDGWLDIFVSGWRLENSAGDIAADYLGYPHTAEFPELYRNNQDGTFTRVASQMGLNRLLLAMGSNFGDLDNDGYLDFYVATGAPDLGLLVPNLMFRNAGGKLFQDVTTAGGFGHLQKGHGVSFGDIDNDGDQDVYAVVGGAFSGDRYWNALFLNPGNGNHWITLRLEGVDSNRSAIGARLRLRLETPGDNRDVYATVSTGGSFGGSTLRQEIGLGDAAAIRSLEITWPSGRRQSFDNVGMDQTLRIREGEAKPVRVEGKSVDLKRAAGHNGHNHSSHEGPQP